MKRKTTIVLLSLLALGSLSLAQTKHDEPQKKTIVDEVVWLVGDEPILLSDIEYRSSSHEVRDSHSKGISTALFQSK